VIPLDVSPLRFRVVVPMEAASECVDLALSLWKERFARVWDRLPLHVGVVAFERALSFQAVIEAARSLEDALTSQKEKPWAMTSKEAYGGVLTLQLRRQDSQMTVRMMPLRMPDGREDVFYPYLRVEDQQLRSPRDFRHPDGALYRYAADLQIGDGVFVAPARVATLFMDSAAARFEKIEPFYAEDWQKARALWQLLVRVAPSQTALQRFRSALNQLDQAWRQGPDQASADLWQATVHALLVEHLGAKGAALEELTEAAAKGLLQHVIQWHLTVLKETL
jgi:hypothetical protein